MILAVSLMFQYLAGSNSSILWLSVESRGAVPTSVYFTKFDEILKLRRIQVVVSVNVSRTEDPLIW